MTGDEKFIIEILVIGALIYSMYSIYKASVELEKEKKEKMKNKPKK